MHRLRGFWDEEMACMTRIYSRLAEPFESFFLTAMNAAGDIAINRENDPKNKTENHQEKTLHLVRTGNR